MKTFATIFTTIALLMGSTASAAPQNGQGAAAGTTTASDNGFAWGIGLGALIVIGVVVGVVAANASDNHTHAH